MVAGDISIEATGQQLASAAMDSYGRLDVLVNNAADFTQMTVEATGEENWQKVLNVNGHERLHRPARLRYLQHHEEWRDQMANMHMLNRLGEPSGPPRPLR